MVGGRSAQYPMAISCLASSDIVCSSAVVVLPHVRLSADKNGKMWRDFSYVSISRFGEMEGVPILLTSC